MLECVWFAWFVWLAWFDFGLFLQSGVVQWYMVAIVSVLYLYYDIVRWFAVYT